MSSQRLYRSQTDKVFAGVCGGLSEYFDVDPVVIRILFVLMVFFGGTGIVLYIAAIFIVPKKPLAFHMPSSEQDAVPSSTSPPAEQNDRLRNWFGIALVAIGFFILLANMEVFHLFDFFNDTFEFIFPVLLIILGMAIIYYRQSQPAQSPPPASGIASESADYTFHAQSQRQFRRSLRDKKIFGVCGGLAEYFGIDSSLMRLLYVVLCLASFGAGFLLYILIALIVPYDTVVKA